MAIALLSVPALRLCHGRLGSNFTALGTVAGVGTRPRIGGTEESAQARRGGIWRTRGRWGGMRSRWDYRGRSTDPGHAPNDRA